MGDFSRRSALGLGAAVVGVQAFPRFAIGQADTRPSISIAVQKISNSNTLADIRLLAQHVERVRIGDLLHRNRDRGPRVRLSDRKAREGLNPNYRGAQAQCRTS